MSLWKSIIQSNRFGMLSKICCTSVIALGMFAPSHAATLYVNSDGVLTGASGVAVGGLGLYDVSFVEGRCDELFSDCDQSSDFAFTNVTDATSAAQALLDQVLIDVPSMPTYNFDSVSEKTFGCTTFSGICAIIIPYDIIYYSSGLMTANREIVKAYNRSSGGGADFTEADELYFAFNTLTSSNQVFARFTQVQASTVPVPAALPLFVSGLAGLGFLSWRKKRKIAATI